ncbi:hypothetical protein C8Q72DRAFT_831461 [Fomitopsis betulina]|nr:hypothetical protein C8Q72DRAFT_831461 [Fomitopsis betulina]
MATKYHLRPIAHTMHGPSPSLSPSTTASSGSERGPTSASSSKRPFLPPAQPDPARLRRPMSPSTSPLRDLELSPVDVSAGAAGVPRRGGFPAPPTGHELMALFPPPPPNSAVGSTSGFFFEQERAFFARKGKEIVTVQIEVDMHAPRGSPHAHAMPPPTQSQRTRGVVPVPAQAAPSPAPYHPHPHPHHSQSAPPPPQPQPHPHARATPPQVPMDVQMQYPMHPPPPPPPLGEHPAETRPPAEGFPEEDEAWRRPMPHSERRRAGKHTKRVIVK